MQLTIDRLSKTYPNGVRALHNVSLTLSNGMFGLLGPNGAGKSSLMRTIATLQEPDSGSIRLDDLDAPYNLDVLNNKTGVRQLLGYLPQEFGVYPRISARQMLDHVARLKGIERSNERKDLVLALLEKVNLYKDRDRKLGTYSGGMKQRWGIAQALVGNPRLIIVDEPTAGLDPAERNRFYNLLSQLGEQTIVILSTHIVEDVSTLCSRFAIICHGEVLYHGEPENAIKSLEGKIFSKRIPQNEIEKHRAGYPIISTQLKAGQLFIRIKSDENPGKGFSPAAPDLEDVYFTHISTKMDINTL